MHCIVAALRCSRSSLLCRKLREIKIFHSKWKWGKRWIEVDSSASRGSLRIVVVVCPECSQINSHFRSFREIILWRFSLSIFNSALFHSTKSENHHSCLWCPSVRIFFIFFVRRVNLQINNIKHEISWGSLCSLLAFIAVVFVIIIVFQRKFLFSFFLCFVYDAHLYFSAITVSFSSEREICRKLSS